MAPQLSPATTARRTRRAVDSAALWTTKRCPQGLGKTRTFFHTAHSPYDYLQKGESEAEQRSVRETARTSITSDQAGSVPYFLPLPVLTMGSTSSFHDEPSLLLPRLRRVLRLAE